MKKIIAFAVLLVGLVLLSMHLWVNGRPTSTIVHPFEKVDFSKVDRLILNYLSNKVALEKKDGRWEVVEPIHDEADQHMIDQILASLKDFTIGSPVSESGARYFEFEIDPGRAGYVAVVANGVQTGGFVGKTTQQYKSFFYRIENSTPVYIATGLDANLMRQAPDAYRSTRIFDMEADVRAIKFVQNGKSMFSMALSSNVWYDNTGKVLDDEGWRTVFFNDLTRLTPEIFQTGTPKAGLEKPYLQISVESSKSTTLLSVGGRSPRPLPVTPDMRFAQISGRETIFTIRDDALSALLAQIKTRK